MDSSKLNSVQVILFVSQLLSERRFDELGELARQDERVLVQLVETVRAGGGMLCLFAATSLVKAGEPAVQPLIEALGDEPYTVRQAAAMALGDMADRRAVEGLVERLGDEHEVVRQAAAVSLGKLGAGEAAEPLLRAIGDESELVRKAVVNALGIIGDRRALQALQRAAAEDTEAVAERARAVVQEMGAKAAPWWRKLWRKG